MRREITDREETAISIRWPGQWAFSVHGATRRGQHGITHRITTHPAGFSCTRLSALGPRTVIHKDPKQGLLKAEAEIVDLCEKVLRSMGE